MTSLDETPTIAITGATAGLGYATMKLLASKGARLILLARNLDKAALAADEAKAAGASHVDVVYCDLSLLSSVRQAASEIDALGSPIDVIINDAAVVTPARVVTAEGNETMLATNYLGPCLLNRLLLAALPIERPVRVISVGGPLDARPDLFDLDCAQSFSFRMAFERSKTALNLFTASLPRHADAAGLRAVVYSPGLMKTSLSATIASEIAHAVGSLATKVLPNPTDRAEGLARLATTTDLTDAAPGTLFNGKGEATPMPLSDDATLQEALWRVTSGRIGLPNDALA